MTREPEEPETDPELEQTIYELIQVLRASPEDSAAYRFAERTLAGLVGSCEVAQLMMEDMGVLMNRLPANPRTGPGQILPLSRWPRRTSE
jgi:hypothetical protein